MIFLKSARFVCLLCFLATSCLWAQQPPTPSNSDTVSTDQLSKEITAFLGREIGAHVADIHSFNPPQERVIAGGTHADIARGTWTRGIATQATRAGDSTNDGRWLAYLIGPASLCRGCASRKTVAASTER